MEGYVVLTVRYDGAYKLISINSQSLFNDVVLELQQYWSHIDFDLVTFCCKVGDISDVTLNSESDFINLMMLCSLTALKIVSVEVNEVSPFTKTFGSPTKKDAPNVLPSDQHFSVSQSHHISIFSSDTNNVLPIEHNDAPPVLSKGWGDLLSSVVGGRVYGSAHNFRRALIKYFFYGFKFKYRQNTSDRIVAYCRDDKDISYKWFIKVKPDSCGKAFVVYDFFGEHLCIDNLTVCPSANQMRPRMIGDLLQHHVRKNPKLNPKDVVDVIKIGYGIDLPYWKARRAANAAKENLLGSFSESYDKISSYLEVLKITNPGSIVVLDVNKSSGAFERVFCGVQFLFKSEKGMLLIATAKDGNNGLFPVGIAVVSAENTDNWAWFLTILCDSILPTKEISFLSDRNTGLLATLPLVECAYATTKEKFDVKFEIFKEVGGPDAKDWLLQLPFDKWALAYSTTLTCFGEMISNAAETFNWWILEARSKPITQMFKHIRTGMSYWVVERRATSNSWNGILVPKKEELWHKLVVMGTTWNVVLCPAGDYEVLSDPSVCVDLKSRTYSCYQWQQTGFPCCHAVAVIKKIRNSIDLDVGNCYLVSNYRQCYSWGLNPVPEYLVLDKWRNKSVDLETSPLVLNRPPGRPKIQKRISSYGEFSRVYKVAKFCRLCQKTGYHDVFTCALNNVERSFTMS